MLHTTIIILESAHSPTEIEMATVMQTAVEAGKQQGYEPVRMAAIDTDGLNVKYTARAQATKWKE